MAVIEVDTDTLISFIGRDVDVEEVKEELFSLGVEIEYHEDGLLGLEVVPDRPDRLSVEGLALSLRLNRGIETGIRSLNVEESGHTIKVERSVSDVRPYITGAIVRDLDLSSGGLDSLIQLQEKLHDTLGRKRNKGAIGVHDMVALKGDEITYRGIDPEEDDFVPLEIGEEKGLREMTPGEVMRDHSVGSQYAHILEGSEYVPVIYDDIGLFSFPPIINGKRTEVTRDTRDVFIEMTGIDQWTIDKMLNILLYTLDARGGDIYSVDVEYESGNETKPDLSTITRTVQHNEIESILGVELDVDDVMEYSGRAGLEASVVSGDDEMADQTYEVEAPPYRTDLLHSRDIIDDIGRAYGFNDLKPRYPDVATVGGLTENTRLENSFRKQLIAHGFQDLLNFVLTNPEDSFERMNREPSDEAVYIENPYSEEYSMMRTAIIPSLMKVLGNNTHREYPQNISEVGITAEQDPEVETGIREETIAAGAIAGPGVGYEDMKSILSSLINDFGKELSTPRVEKPSMIEGRSGAVEIDGERVGVIGEIHPEVLSNWEVLQPVAAFEFEIDSLK